LRLRTKAADGSNEKSDQWMRECAELESNLPDIPQAQRLWTSDSTPEKLADMLANYGEIFGWFSSEAGFFARFMYFIPRSPLGYREFNTTPVPAEITAEYKKQIREMIDWCSQDSDGEPKIVTLNNDALEMWKEFRDDIEHRMRPGADLCELTDFGGKAPGAAARVACVFHAIDMVADGQQPWEVPISFETMNSALRFTKCAIEHSIHSFQTMGFCTEANAPRDILKWLERNNHRPPNVRDIYNGLRGRYPKADPIHKAVKLLQNYGYVRTHQKAKSGAGQPASPVVEIRPGLFS
jgi:hypothetical protein